ncbi:unnamed protein product [Schistosoma mattheei]|uniref:Uncharacterized protein n=1 Tax=Schistosoma mattheei TaxID=31246 RepID=A0A183P2E9_9TREM|nr:unnamed protein product [Schistosoma mattheei]
MVEPTGTYVPANIARLAHHDRQARPPRQEFILVLIRLSISILGSYVTRIAESYAAFNIIPTRRNSLTRCQHVRIEQAPLTP